MEKTGALLLTEDEKRKILSGMLPSRLAENWGYSLDELLNVIKQGNYNLIGNYEKFGKTN